MRESKLRFIRQQGVAPADCNRHLYGALMFQPRIIGGVVAVGVLLQSASLFLALAVILSWSALVPARNPFDAIYNHVIASPRRYPPLGGAPPPRRFAQGLAGGLTLAIGVALLAGAERAAWAGEGMLGIAIAALIFGRFCAGSFVYHVMRGGSLSGRALRQCGERSR